MNGRILQLWVERLELDPAAWTAGHTLQLLMGLVPVAKVEPRTGGVEVRFWDGWLHN